MNKAAIASAFGRAAPGYDQFASLQQRCGARLLALAGKRSVHQVLDAGCGTGLFSQQWQTRGSEVTALDLSLPMLAVTRQRQAARYVIQGDIEQLPFANGQFDLCWSNLAIQWCSVLSRALSELHRVTAAEGSILVSTLAQGSLAELHQAWRGVDQRLHANLYPDAQTIAGACPAAGLQWRQYRVSEDYPDVISALRSLKGIGATYLSGGRQRGTLTRGQLQQLTLAWPRCQGRFRLTYQVMLGVRR